MLSQILKRFKNSFESMTFRNLSRPIGAHSECVGLAQKGHSVILTSEVSHIQFEQPIGILFNFSTIN